MRHLKTMLLSAALIVGTTTFAAAQAVVPVQWGWGLGRDNDDRQAFKEGYNQGKSDARHNRRFDPDNNRWRERDDRQAFRSGQRLDIVGQSKKATAADGLYADTFREVCGGEAAASPRPSAGG